MLLVLFVAPSMGQSLDPVSIEQLANTDIAADQHGPEIATAPDGSYVVCWHEGSWSGGSLHARRFSNDHTPLGDQTLLTSIQISTSKIQHYAGSEYIVAFRQLGSNDLYFVVFDASDASVSNEILVREEVSGYDFDLKGNEIVWLYEEDQSTPQMFLRGYSLSTNDWVNSEVLVTEDSGGTYNRPNIVVHNDGSMTAIYNYRELVSGCCTYNNSINRKTFTSDYLAEQPEYSIFTLPSDQYVVNGGLVATGNANDEVLIATSHGNTFSGRFWRGWIIARNGDVLMPETIFLSGGNNDWYGEPQAHFYDNGDFVFVSTHRDGGFQDPDDAEAWALYASNYNAENSGWDEMNSTIAGQQRYGCLAALPNGGFVAAWDGNGFQGDAQGIYVRAFNGVAFPGVRIEYTGDLSTDETGTEKSVDVTLTTPPLASVTVDLSSDNTAEGMVNTDQLVFTVDNWDTPQTILLQGQDDTVDDGDVVYHLVASTSASLDATYAGLVDKNFDVVNLDDDANITPPGDQEVCKSDGLSGANAIITNNGSAITAVTVSSSDASVIDDSDITVVQLNPTTWQIAIGELDNNSTGTAVLTIVATDGLFDYEDTFEITTTGINISAGPDLEVCVGTEITLTADNPDAATFEWSDGIVDGAAFTPEAGTNTYTVTASDGACEVSDEVVVQVNEVPQNDLDAGEDLSVCEGSTITLSASNPDGFTITWSDGVTDGEAFTQDIGTETYTVSATVASCLIEDAVTVEVYAAPDIAFAIEGTAEACEGDEITLTVSATEDLDVSWDNGINDGVPFTAEAGETTYTASAEFEGCNYEASITVDVQEALDATLDAGENVAVCEGEEVTLQAENPDGLAIVWDQGVLDGQPFEQTAAEQTYTVTGTLGLCSIEDNVTVTVNPLPPVPTITFFGGELISSSAEGNQWYINGGIIPNETDQYIDPLTNGDYVVVVTIEGCSSSSEPFTFIADNVSELASIANVYPNPTADVLFIELEGAFDIDLLDHSGRLVLCEQGQNQLRLDMTEMASGIYFIRLTQAGMVWQTKVVKN